MRELSGWEASGNLPTAEQAVAAAAGRAATAEPVGVAPDNKQADRPQYLDAPGYGHIEVARAPIPRELTHLDSERRVAREVAQAAAQIEQASDGGEDAQEAAQAKRQEAEARQTLADQNRQGAQQERRQLKKD